MAITMKVMRSPLVAVIATRPPAVVATHAPAVAVVATRAPVHARAR